MSDRTLSYMALILFISVIHALVGKERSPQSNLDARFGRPQQLQGGLA